MNCGAYLCPSCFPHIVGLGFSIPVGQYIPLASQQIPTSPPPPPPSPLPCAPFQDTSTATGTVPEPSQRECGKWRKECRNGTKCERVDCYFDHPPWGWNPKLNAIDWTRFWQLFTEHMTESCNAIVQLCGAGYCAKKKFSPAEVYAWTLKNEKFNHEIQKIYRKLFSPEYPFEVIRVTSDKAITGRG